MSVRMVPFIGLASHSGCMSSDDPRFQIHCGLNQYKASNIKRINK